MPDSSPESFVLVTGASSGIGEGFAREFASRGMPLILTARRDDRLRALAAELGGRVPVRIITEDLNDPAAPGRIARMCGENNWRVGGLLNNAGLGYNKSFSKLSAEQVHRMVQVNLVALVELTRLFLPGMLAAQKGFVLNIASTAGIQPVPYFSVYAATKTFVISFSEGLHEELRASGVHVGCVCPGPVDTEFQLVAGMHPRFFARSQKVEDVVRVGMRLLERRGAVAWTSPLQAFFAIGSGLTPRVVRRRIAGWLMKSCGAE